ncbi:mRNA decay activator protein ZFP36 (G0/G1 switch regulatory protein 24) (Growth factor-inducible nuclear protein NUP475) (Tristetraprolin) (Zinc finger protein 36) (Zfp-36) [Durusdinium trenchii]|uniref:mRNA decay activator protein ZFP36 (G0/G1 switch regulatory protein 24) (Growth factor-inducible nuclear protein NUP475) (Tristetraprolin) (Zinc finger protein 36) (Zfp-36) n=1 Tax=Durusdinium trenchii TaxID=1381693 RepID=A0ABP0KD02_9DINO
MAPPRASTRPSRADMLMSGVPEDYIDALLNEKYMEDLIAATNKQYQKREKKRNREDRLQKVILLFLICQAILGVAVAAYKTLLQPDKVISAFVNMENIDMVLMIDTSNHMVDRLTKQQDVVLKFSEEMLSAMKLEREQTLQKNVERVEEIKRKSSTAISRFLSHFFETNAQDHTGLSGTFAHGLGELQALPDLSKTSLCQAFAESGVCRDANCSFAHGVEELRATKKFYKTSMCKFHMMRQCRMGAYCRHAHDESELQEVPPDFLEEEFSEEQLLPTILLRDCYEFKPRMHNLFTEEGQTATCSERFGMTKSTQYDQYFPLQPWGGVEKISLPPSLPRSADAGLQYYDIPEPWEAISL